MDFSETINAIGYLWNAIDVRFVWFSRTIVAISSCCRFVIWDARRWSNTDRFSQTMFEHHVVDRWQGQAGTHNVFNTWSLAVERVDDGSTFRNKRSLKYLYLNTVLLILKFVVRWHYLAQVAEDGEYRVKWLVGRLMWSLERNSLTKFSENHQIEDDGAGQQRILARVVDNKSIVSTHHNLGRVFVHCSLTVTCRIVNSLFKLFHFIILI